MALTMILKFLPETALRNAITAAWISIGNLRMVGGMFELVIHDVPKEKAVRYVSQLHSFYTAGWRALMEI